MPSSIANVGLEHTLCVSVSSVRRDDIWRDPSPTVGAAFRYLACFRRLERKWCAARSSAQMRRNGGATHVRDMYRLWRGPVMVLKSLVQPSVSCRHGRGLTKQSCHGLGLLSGPNSTGSPRLAWGYRSVKRFVAPRQRLPCHTASGAPEFEGWRYPSLRAVLSAGIHSLNLPHA
jgi:hypothetical protein